MKRLMMMVAMMAFVLLLPMNAEAAGETVIEGDWVIEDSTQSIKIVEDTIVNGDMEIKAAESIDVSNCTLHIKGDLIINDVNHGTRIEMGKLIVGGNITLAKDNFFSICEESVLEVGENVTVLGGSFWANGDNQIKGDFVQEGGFVSLSFYENENENYLGGNLSVVGTGEDGFEAGNLTVDGNVNVEGDLSQFFAGELVVNGNINMDIKSGSQYGVGFNVITVKGNFIVNDETKSGEIIDDLNMVGDATQILDLPKEWKSDNINFVNQDIKVCNYLNGKLGSDITGMTLEDGILRTAGLELEGYNLTVPGDMHAEGKVEVYSPNFDYYNPVYSQFVVEGNYVQETDKLQIEGGGYKKICINGDLRLQSVDEARNYGTGSGSMFTAGGDLYIGGDIVIDTTEDMRGGVFAPMYVGGDITQISRSVFMPDYVILNGSEPQSVTLLRDDSVISTQSMINTLELTQERKHYTFNPEPCWKKLIQLEGIRNTAEGFKYYEDGNWISDAYKYVKYDGATFLVANGVVATGINGIAQDPLNPQDWYFLSGGQVQEQHTGLAEYDGQWFYVENGKLDTTMNQCIEYDGALFMLAEGRIISETSGLVMDPKSGNWYFLADGQAKIEYTGLAFYDETWFYVEKGILAEGFTGKVKYDGQYFNVVNGMVK